MDYENNMFNLKFKIMTKYDSTTGRPEPSYNRDGGNGCSNPNWGTGGHGDANPDTQTEPTVDQQEEAESEEE